MGFAVDKDIIMIFREMLTRKSLMDAIAMEHDR
jgi:hypothetical protein